MVRIIEFDILDEKKIRLKFSDNKKKTIDFTPFIGKDKLSKPLSDPDYFRKVELYENGRGIFWPNGYDFCPDFLRRYKASDEELLATN